MLALATMRFWLAIGSTETGQVPGFANPERRKTDVCLSTLQSPDFGFWLRGLASDEDEDENG